MRRSRPLHTNGMGRRGGIKFITFTTCCWRRWCLAMYIFQNKGSGLDTFVLQGRYCGLLFSGRAWKVESAAANWHWWEICIASGLCKAGGLMSFQSDGKWWDGWWRGDAVCILFMARTKTFAQLNGSGQYWTVQRQKCSIIFVGVTVDGTRIWWWHWVKHSQ